MGSYFTSRTDDVRTRRKKRNIFSFSISTISYRPTDTFLNTQNNHLNIDFKIVLLTANKRRKIIIMDETLESPCHQKEVVDLASLLANPQRRIDPVTWKEICPGLSLTSAVHKNDAQNGKTEVTPDTQIKVKRRQEKLTNDGYALVDDYLDVKLIREGIEALHHRKLPATFILMFDETWKLALESKRILEKSSHKKNIFNYDLLAWYIPPGSAGFSPHRDRQPEDASTTFHSDNQPKFITQWIALSDATPGNSCLYVIPKPYDPGYTTGDITEESTSSINDNPLYRALSTKESFQHIRCLPRKAGQSILFTHRIIHWGSQGDDDVGRSGDNSDDDTITSISPRIAISFVCSDPDFESPLLVNHTKYFADTENSENNNSLIIPPLRIRLLLICAQLLIYYQRFDIDKSVIKACYNYCKYHEQELTETYRRKVYVEFVKAMKEQVGSNNDNSIGTTNASVNASCNVETTNDTSSPDDRLINDDDDECDDDDEEDAMMEEMLNAEAGGYGEFEDDYDDMEQKDEIDQKENNSSEDEDDLVEAEEDLDLFGKRKKEITSKADTKLPLKKVKTTKTYI
jgi:hypothetical protein